MGVTSVRIKPEIEKPLELLSKELERSKNYLINQALKEFIARRASEGQKWEETLGALESVKNGNVVEEAKVTDWLNSWGSATEKKAPEV